MQHSGCTRPAASCLQRRPPNDGRRFHSAPSPHSPPPHCSESRLKLDAALRSWADWHAAKYLPGYVPPSVLSGTLSYAPGAMQVRPAATVRRRPLFGTLPTASGGACLASASCGPWRDSAPAARAAPAGPDRRCRAGGAGRGACDGRRAGGCCAARLQRSGAETMWFNISYERVRCPLSLGAALMLLARTSLPAAGRCTRASCENRAACCWVLPSSVLRPAESHHSRHAASQMKTTRIQSQSGMRQQESNQYIDVGTCAGDPEWRRHGRVAPRH